MRNCLALATVDSPSQRSADCVRTQNGGHQNIWSGNNALHHPLGCGVLRRPDEFAHYSVRLKFVIQPLLDQVSTWNTLEQALRYYS